VGKDIFLNVSRGTPDKGGFEIRTYVGGTLAVPPDFFKCST
jgi:hypothetical protein